MAFLTLAGIDLDVFDGSPVERKRLVQGARVRMRAGNIISTERDPKRVLDCRIRLVDRGAEAALRDACPIGEAVVAEGTWIDEIVGAGESLDVLVDIGDTTARRQRRFFAGLGGGAWVWTFDLVAELHLEQAS